MSVKVLLFFRGGIRPPIWKRETTCDANPIGQEGRLKRITVFNLLSLGTTFVRLHLGKMIRLLQIETKSFVNSHKKDF